jgi:hypothetical protein
LLGCDGQIIYPGQTTHTIDLCGICGGNNTACVGCDGTFYGPTVHLIPGIFLFFPSMITVVYVAEMELLAFKSALQPVAKNV